MYIHICILFYIAIAIVQITAGETRVAHNHIYHHAVLFRVLWGGNSHFVCDGLNKSFPPKGYSIGHYTFMFNETTSWILLMMQQDIDSPTCSSRIFLNCTMILFKHCTLSLLPAEAHILLQCTHSIIKHKNNTGIAWPRIKRPALRSAVGKWDQVHQHLTQPLCLTIGPILRSISWVH